MQLVYECPGCETVVERGTYSDAVATTATWTASLFGCVWPDIRPASIKSRQIGMMLFSTLPPESEIAFLATGDNQMLDR